MHSRAVAALGSLIVSSITAADEGLANYSWTRDLEDQEYHREKRDTWAFQVMNEQVQRTSLYKYEDNGKNPRDSRLGQDGDTFPVPETPPISENNQIFQSRNISLESAIAVHDKDGNGRDRKGTDNILLVLTY
ncbi:hypothetical protein WN944_026597 [Citrus x changshan-huyou]|uniref:Uncharacterized protein n=1 Tax=Citrus x changshan-huyou TaxID=2935761 RepID=A0AAP0LWJ8_9ROSI